MIATAINCIDGRAQLPVIEYLMKERGAASVDMITEPGADRVVAEGGPEGGDAEARIRFIREKLDLSLKRRGSELVAVVGHFDCLGNPEEKDGHVAHIKRAVERVSSWHPEVAVIGLWVGSDWAVTEV